MHPLEHPPKHSTVVVGRAAQVRMVINKHCDKPFQYGKWDCCQFINDVAIAIRGVDFSTRFPSYKGIDNASVLLEEHGGVEGIATMCLGKPSMEQRTMEGLRKLSVGDCVSVYIHPLIGLLLGIWDGTDGVFIKTDGGVIRINDSHVSKAWSM